MINLKEKPFNLSEEKIEWVNNTLRNLTSDEKVEQLFCPLLFTNNPEDLKHIIEKYKFGGIMFRSGNSEEIQTAINALQSTSKIPLLISGNLEDGGNGIANDGTYMGRPMLMAASGETEKAYQLGRVCGKEGKAVGLNWSFSPVVDIDMNYHNPIVNVRTYGDNAEDVLRFGQAYVKGLTEEGVQPTIKHFPGDGVDERDQHLLTSVNSLSIEEWEDTFGKVYRGLIDDGAMTVMNGHIAMPAMEEYFDQQVCNQVIPSSLSKNVNRYLREVLNFNGLVITDASPMVGFTAVSRRKEAVPMSIENGCDMFLFTRDLDEDVRFMKEGLAEGTLSEERLDEAVTRILAAKASVGLNEVSIKELINDKMELKVLSAPNHIEWAKECADAGVTLVKDTQKLLPLNVNKHKRVLLQILGDFDSNDRVYNQFKDLLINEGFEVTKYVPETLATIFLDGKVNDFKAKYDLVMYIGNIENASNKTVSRIQWHTLFGAGNNLPWFAMEVPTLFVSVGNPYHLLDVPMVKTYINGYCHSPYVIESVFEKIMGRSQFKGINPVDPFCGKWDTKL